LSIAVVLFRLRDAAKLDHRLPTRFYGVHASTEIVFDVHLEMAFNFGRKLRIMLVFSEQPA
jgi:hypothetical protein